MRSATVGDICEFKYGKSLPAGQREAGSTQVYGSNGPVGTHSRALVDGPAIIVGRKGSYGEVHYSDGPAWPIDTTYYVDKDAAECDLRWLYYLLRHLPLTTLNKSAAIPGLNREDAYRLAAHVPSMDEQRRIAAILDKADALRRKRRRTIELLDSLSGSIFSEMFGASGRESERRSIGSVCTVGSGSTPRREDQANFGGNICWVKTTEVKGDVISDTEEKVTGKGAGDARLRLYPRGTVLIAMYGQGSTRGKVGILGVEATMNQACAALVPGPELDPVFLFHQLKQKYKELRSLGRGGNQPNLNGELVKNFEISVPALERQNDFVQKIEKISHQTHLMKASLAVIEASFSSLQHCAFSGKL